VAPDGKAAARKQVADAVAAGGFGAREVVVRINGLDTEWWLDDLNAAAKAKPDAVLVPKVSVPSHLEDVAERLVDISADQKIRIWAMMETPLAMLNAGEIAAAARDVETRLTAFVMGTNDLAKDTRAKITPDAPDGALADGLRDGRTRAWRRHPRRRLQ
jgi:citrate lyase subunit beta/citryl-CoA lyase